ncbi:MAG: Rid family hydrolase [Caulobacteraceae bacterium]
MTTKTLLAGAGAALTLAVAGSALAAPAKTVLAPGATPETAAKSPISAGAIVSPGSTIFFVSGIPGSPTAGNTEAQTTDSLTKLKAVLEANGFTLSDVANAKVFLVGDPANGGKMDTAGMNKAFSTFFGTAANPVKPSRVTVQIAGLAAPGSLVEIELTAVK